MPEKRKLVFVNTHPVQYYAPLYQKIAADNFFDLEVWYFTKHGLDNELDKEFNTKIKWDIPVLEGYNYKFIKNISWKPGLYSGFFGAINPGIFGRLRKLPRNSIVVANAWNPFSCLFTIICSKILGHITCLRAEPPLVHEFGRSKKAMLLRKLFLKGFLFRFIDIFLYIGTQNRKFFEFYGIPSSKLYFSPYSVNNAFFQEKAAELFQNRAAFKESLKIPAGNKIILFSGKLIPKKRPLDLLAAFATLEKNHNCSLVFMGDGELRPAIEEAIALQNIREAHITGFVNQSKISDYYSVADIFTMCSDVGETWGLSTNEAMNFGLPVVISDKTGNFDDLVKDNGYVFKTGDVKDLANKLSMLLSATVSERTEMEKASIQIVSGFSYDVVIANLKKIN